MIFLFYNQTSCKKVRNTIHDIPVYNQTSCKKTIHEEIQFMIFLFIIKPRVKK